MWVIIFYKHTIRAHSLRMCVCVRVCAHPVNCHLNWGSRFSLPSFSALPSLLPLSAWLCHQLLLLLFAAGVTIWLFPLGCLSLSPFPSPPASASLPRPVDLRVNTDDHILCLILLLLCEFVCSSDFPSHSSSFAKCAECIFRIFHIFRLILLSNTCDYLSYVAFYYCQICIRLDGPGSLVVSRQSLLPRLDVSFSLMVVCLGHRLGKGMGGEGWGAATADCIGLTNCETDMAIYAAIAL